MGAGGLGLAGGVFSNIRAAQAEALSGELPEVDSLSVLVPYPCGRARSRLNLLASEPEVSCPTWVSTSRPSAL